MFQIKNLTKTYGKTTVVDNVSFTLEHNRCIALIGPNGAGKTTTLRMLTGAIKRTNGTCIKTDQKEADIRKYIGYLPQEPTFYPWMTGIQFLTYCANIHEISKEVAKERIDEVLKQVDIYDARNKRIGAYSGGMKQRLGIAQAIIHKPSLLLLDEPVSALDPIGRRDVLTLMEQLKKEMTILFSTHILNDADEVSDELILMHHGKVVESGNMATLRKKYETAIIDIQFSENNEVYEQHVRALPSVIDISKSRSMMHVSVTDIEDARREILEKSMTENWPLHHFAVNEASLEDMFMKVVQSCSG